MTTLSDYENGYTTVMKLAGFDLTGPHSNIHSSGGAVGGMAAGSALGGRLGESLAKKTRREILGISIPGTEKFNPDTAHTIGAALGAIGGGYLGHQYGSMTGQARDNQAAQAAQPPHPLLAQYL